jgi:hypothetical protein
VHSFISGKYINGKQIGFSLALHLQCVALSLYNQFVEVFLEPCFNPLPHGVLASFRLTAGGLPRPPKEGDI